MKGRTGAQSGSPDTGPDVDQPAMQAADRRQESAGRHGRPDFAAPSVRAVALFPLKRQFEGRTWFGPLLERYGLVPAQIQDPYEVIPLTAFLDLLEEAARLAEDPILGARLGQQMSPADLGPAGMLTAQSSTIRRGLTRYSQSISALQSATEMRLSDAADTADLTYLLRVPDVVRWPQDAELSLSSACMMIRACFDRRWSPLEVHFMHGRSPGADALRRIFRAPVRFGQSANRIVFDPAVLDRPYRTEDGDLVAIIERHIADLGLAREPGLGVVERVRSIISRRLGRSPCTLAAVAAELGVTTRSLQRLLEQEGTSLRMILREQRQQLIEMHLRDRDLRLGDVAEALGYSDGTVLWRAYRGWTGEAPSRQRRSTGRKAAAG